MTTLAMLIATALAAISYSTSDSYRFSKTVPVTCGLGAAALIFVVVYSAVISPLWTAAIEIRELIQH